jgi:phage replication-related protein YjqB (UPF0714/DUF867 family)
MVSPNDESREGGRMDRYLNFAHLSAKERLGQDYAICFIRRSNRIAIIAPHGGWIEPGTSEIARAIAADDFSFYSFEGLKRRPHRDLHITSSAFDEPQCIELVLDCTNVVAVHGAVGAERWVKVGGLDEGLRDAICASLLDAGFSAQIVTNGELAGTHPNNICNRGSSRAGVQLEISRGLRDLVLGGAAELERFVAPIQSTIAEA